MMVRIASSLIFLILLMVSSSFAAAAPTSAEALALGKQTFAKQCAPCHGANGRGDGEAAYLLYPRARNFHTGKFRVVSTWEGVPTDEDLFNTITRGMPGSPMPSWRHLPEHTRWALVAYIKSLRDKPIVIKPAKAPPSDGGVGTGVVSVPPEPAYDDAAKARARQLFADACASCHGPTGKGDGVTEQRDENGLPILPRDLTAGVFAGSPDPQSLYRRIVAGVPGTPMPMSDWAYGKDAWNLVHFVLSLSTPEQRAAQEMRRFSIPVARVDAVPKNGNSPLWSRAKTVGVHLMPLWRRRNRPAKLNVKALHDGSEIAMLLEWKDPTHNLLTIRPQDFRDAAAVELSTSKDPPFFAMGQRGQFVDIWMWASDRETRVASAADAIRKAYPDFSVEPYPNWLKPAVKQTNGKAPAGHWYSNFLAASDAGNIVADQHPKSAGENLRAQGFGTLRARPKMDQAVEAHGSYRDGTYRVLFRRSLDGIGEGSVYLRPGSTVSAGFAVWDGAAGDTDGKKLVTIWQELKLQK